MARSRVFTFNQGDSIDEQATNALVAVALHKTLAGARVEVKRALHDCGAEFQPEAKVFTSPRRP
ncbi:hypothetical protein GCM10012319_70270 [Comamonas sp. KCTC 72670]|nr:hypothetical protein GCM10012319_70270 [Comamonas sp. KCTC 72670]